MYPFSHLHSDLISSNWYMLGKCLWKLFNCSKTSSVSYKQPVDAFIKAIECVPEKRDNRHPEKDPILEPHYKLLAVTHKLVHGRHMTVSKFS